MYSISQSHGNNTGQMNSLMVDCTYNAFTVIINS